MGGGNSQSIEQIFNLESINESIFKQITKNTQSVSASNSNIQKLQLKVGNIGPKCKLKIGQKIDAKVVSTAEMSPETIANTKDEVKNDLQTSAEAALEKVTEAGNFQFGDSQDVSQEINQSVTNVVDKTFDTNNLNELRSEILNLQEETISVGDCNGKVDINQDIVATLMAEAITESLTVAISDNEFLNTLAAEAGATSKSENKGLADIVDSFFEGITGWIKYVAIACVVCVCVICLGGTLFLLSPGGQQSATTISNAGASRLKKGH